MSNQVFQLSFEGGGGRHLVGRPGRAVTQQSADRLGGTNAARDSEIDAVGEQCRQRVEYLRHLERAVEAQQDSCRADPDATGICGDRRDHHLGTGDLQVRVMMLRVPEARIPAFLGDLRQRQRELEAAPQAPVGSGVAEFQDAQIEVIVAHGGSLSRADG
jgi:hypothetical protein